MFEDVFEIAVEVLEIDIHLENVGVYDKSIKVIFGTKEFSWTV